MFVAVARSVDGCPAQMHTQTARSSRRVAGNVFPVQGGPSCVEFVCGSWFVVRACLVHASSPHPPHHHSLVARRRRRACASSRPAELQPAYVCVNHPFCVPFDVVLVPLRLHLPQTRYSRDVPTSHALIHAGHHHNTRDPRRLPTPSAHCIHITYMPLFGHNVLPGGVA